jgi:hypothetical protein
MPIFFTYLLTPVAVVMPPRRARGNPLDPCGDSMGPVAMLAPAGAAQGARGGGVPRGAVPAGAAPGGGAEVPLPVSGLSLMQWMGMKLDTLMAVVLRLRRRIG